MLTEDRRHLVKDYKNIHVHALRRAYLKVGESLRLAEQRL